MNEEALKALYEDVSLSYEVGTLDDFKAYLSDSQKRELFFNQVIQPEYDVQSIDDFELAYGLKKKDESDSISQEVVTESVTPTEEEEVISSDVPEIITTEQESVQTDLDVEPIKVGFEEESEVPAEKLTAIERTFGKNAFTDFFGDMYRAGVQGQTQGGTLDEAMTLFSGGADVSDEQIEEFIRANEELANVPPSDEMQDFQKIYENNGGGVLGFILGVAKNPTVVPQLFVSSVSAMANPTSAKAALATGAAGAGVGFVATPIGAAAGALGGLMAGAGGALETGLTFAELLQEDVDGELTKESIRKVLEDEDAYNRIKNKSLARGLTIAAVEGLSGGLAGKVTSKVVGATGRKLAGTAAGIGVESVGGSVGEVAGRLAAGQEMDVAEIGFEGIAGTATAPLSVGYGLYKAPKYSINKSRNGELATVSGPDMAKFIRTATPEQLLQSEVTIENDSELQNIYDDKFKEASVENDIQQADPSMNEPTRKAITNLQLQLNELQGNESQVAKDKAAQLRSEIKELQDNPLTEETDAIQEPSTETVDVQEQAGDSKTVGERDAEVSELTTETTQEVQESDVSPEVQAEIDAIEADDRVDLSELDAITPTQEATSNLQSIEEFYNGQIEDIQEEITLEQSNTKEGIAEIKSKIADVRKDKSLSKDEKFEAIEDLKAELEDFKQEQRDVISTYKDDIRVAKAEMKADVKEAKKSTPEFRLKSAAETQVDAVESAKVTDVINEIDSPNKEVQLAFQSSSPISVDGLNKRTDTPLNSTTLKVVDGIPTIFTITDQLTTGNTVNPETGNTIDNLKGAVGFNGTEGHENFAWANLGVNEGNAIISKAIKVAEDNPSIFEKWWKENPEYNGLVPMNVVKMGEGAMISNEATFRVLADNISTLPTKNRKAALSALKREVKSEIKKLSSINKPTSNNKKDLSLYRKIQSEISNAKATSIEQTLSNEFIDNLSLAARVLLINKIAYGSVGEPGLKIKTPGTPNKTVTKALLEGQPKEFRRKVNLGVITDVITDPELRNVPIGNIVSLVGVDVLNPEVLETTHPNYKYGVKGKSIGVLENPVPMEKAYPKTYEKSFKVLIDKESKGMKVSGPTIISQQSGVGMGIASLDYVGAMTSSNSENVNKLISFLNESFPSVTLSVSSKEFNDIMNTEGVKKYLKGDEVVYGVTVNGDVYVNPEVHNSESTLFNTAIHEMGHIWTDYLQTTKKGREMHAKGVELVKETDTYREQLEVFNGDEAKAANEALAILIGNKGETITDGATKSKFKEWLLGLWNYIKKQFKQFKDLTSKEIQDLTLDQWLGTALRDILGGKPIKLTPKQRAAMKADVAFRKMSPSNKKTVRSVVEKLRGLGYSEVAIGKILKQRGVESNLISEILTTSKKASPKAKVTEDVVPGFDRLKNEIDGIIQKSKERGVKFNKIIDNVIKYVEGSRVYETATDNVREQLIRDIRKEFKLNEKTAPSVSKILGVIKDVKKVTIRETDLLKLRIQEAVKAAKGAKDFARKFKTQIANDLYALVNKGQLTQRQSVVIAKRLAQVDINSQKSIDNFTDYVAKVFNDSTGKYKKSVIKDIAAFVKDKSKKAITDSNKARGRGLDAQGQAFFEAASRVLSRILDEDFNADAIEKKFFPDIEDILSKEKDLTVKEQAQLDAYTAFEIFKGIDDMNVQEVEQLFEDLKSERSESISRLKDKLKKEKAELKQLRDEADSNIKEGYPELFDEEGKPLNEEQRAAKKDSIYNSIMSGKLYTAVKEYVKKFNPADPGSYLNSISNNLKNLGTLTNGLDKVGKFFNDKVYNHLNRMESKYVKGLQSTRDKMDEISSSIDGITSYKDIKNKLNSGIHKIKGITTGEGKALGTDLFNADQLMRVYALSKNNIQREKLKKQGFTDEKMAQIESILGPEVVEFTDKVVEYLSTEYFEQTNDVYKDVNNVNLGFVENYFPTQTVQTRVDSKLLDEGNFNGVFNAQVAPALKERLDLTGDVKILSADFTSVIDNHFETIERYKAYAKGVKTLNSLFNFNSVSALLDETGMSKVVRNAVNFAVNPNGGKQSIQPTLIDKLMTKYTGFALAFKAVQIAKQATSFINALEDYSYRGPGKKKIPGLDLAMFMIDHAKNIATLPISIREMYNTSPMVRERLKQGLEGDVYGLETGSVTFKPVKKQSGLFGKVIRAFKTAAGFPTVAGDILGVMGYWANYKRDIANGMSKEKALEKFEKYNATQQSRRPADKIPLQMNTNAYVRAFTMFGSTLFLQINKVMQTFTNIMRSASKGKMPTAKDTRGLLLNLGAANVLFQITANAFKYSKGTQEDEEEVIRIMKDAMIGLNLIYQVPFFGAAVESMVNKARGTRRPVDVAVNPLTSVINKAKKIAKDDKPVEAIVRTATELTIGAQADPFIGLYNGFSEGFDDEVMYDVLGVSSSYRPSDNTPTKSESLKQLKEFNPKAYEKLMKQQEKEKLKKQKLKEKMERKSK